MRLFDILRGAITGARIGAQVSKSAGADWIDNIFRTGRDTLEVQARLSQPYAQHATIHRAIKVFAQNVARVPLEFFTKGTDEKVEVHPIIDLFRKPNALMRGNDLLKAISIDYQHWGDAIIWMGEVGGPTLSRQGRIPEFLKRLDPRKTRGPFLDDNDDPIGYETLTRSGVMRKIPAIEILHFKDWNPYDPARGLGWVDAARDEVETDFFAQAWNRLFFRRGATPDGILQPQKGHTVTEPQSEKIRLSILARHQGVERSHGPMILPSGLEYIKTGIGQKEMDFATLRNVSRENTLSAGGIPPAVAGILQFANYANMAPQLRLFFEFDVIPFLHFFEAVIQCDLLDRLGIGLDVRFNVETINTLLEDQESKARVAAAYWTMGVPLAVINEKFGIGLDLDDVKTAETSFLPFSVQPADLAIEPEPDPVPAPAPPPPADPDPDPDDGSGDPDPDKVVSISGGTRSGREIRRAAVWRALARIPRSLVSRAETGWRDHLRKLLKETLAKLAAAEERAKSARSRAHIKVIPGEEEFVAFGLAAATQEGQLVLEPIWRGAMLRGSDSVSAQIGVQISFDFFDPAVVQAITRRRVAIARSTTKLQAKLRAVIGESAAEGHAEELTRQRVLDVFSGARTNARTIARTEVHSAFSEGRHQSMIQANIKRVEWLTSRDGNVRPVKPSDKGNHQILDEEQTPIGEPFSNGLMYPLDPSGPPEEVINCRCQSVPAGSII